MHTRPRYPPPLTLLGHHRQVPLLLILLIIFLASLLPYYMMTLTIEDFRKKLRDIVGNFSMEGTRLRVRGHLASLDISNVPFTQLNLLNTTIHTLPLPLQRCHNYWMMTPRRLYRGPLARRQTGEGRRFRPSRVLDLQVPRSRVAACDRAPLLSFPHLLLPLKALYLPHPINQCLINI